MVNILPFRVACAIAADRRDRGSQVRTRLPPGGGSHERTRLCFEKFPASSEFAGNFARFGFSVAFQAPKTYANPSPYGANSLGIGAGNFYDVAGNSIGQSGNVAAGSGILLSFTIFLVFSIYLSVI